MMSFFLINSFLYIDYLGVFHEGTTNFDSFVDGAEFAGTITRYYNRVGIIILVGCCQRHRVNIIKNDKNIFFIVFKFVVYD